MLSATGNNEEKIVVHSATKAGSLWEI